MSCRQHKAGLVALACCLAATVAALDGPLQALAQEGSEPVAVLDRPRGAFDAKGIDLGGFRLFPRASISETYDDNVFADENDTKDDLITSVAASLLAKSEWSRHQLQVLGQVRNQTFVDNTDEDRVEYVIRPQLRLEPDDLP